MYVYVRVCIYIFSEYMLKSVFIFNHTHFPSSCWHFHFLHSVLFRGTASHMWLHLSQLDFLFFVF